MLFNSNIMIIVDDVAASSVEVGVVTD